MTSPLPNRTDLPDLSGQLFDGRYRMLEKTGEGGMAFVYVAEDSESGDKVAVKILLPTLAGDDVSISRLRLEAELASKLVHPNVCHVIRLGRSDTGFDYVVMPFLEGELLGVRAWNTGALPLDVTARFVRDIAAGLHAAHQLGIIHRDLKPENIMIVANPDGTERAVLMDFGLATAPHLLRGSPKLTKMGMVVGTPEFMSPEQVRGQALDPRSDLYSLAFMTYELLTRELPFDGKTLNALIIARLKGQAIPLRTRRPDLAFPAAVEQVLMKALSIDPAHRYATTLQFAEAFSLATQLP